MRRDWGIIKMILSDLADGLFNEYDPETDCGYILAEHYEMLEEAGLIEIIERTEEDEEDEYYDIVEVPRLTWKGQNLLEILEGNLIFNDKQITEQFRSSLI